MPKKIRDLLNNWALLNPEEELYSESDLEQAKRDVLEELDEEVESRFRSTAELELHKLSVFIETFMWKKHLGYNKHEQRHLPKEDDKKEEICCLTCKFNSVECAFKKITNCADSSCCASYTKKEGEKK